MSTAPVLLDTNVASFLLMSRPEGALYGGDLRGRRGAVSFQTAAELLSGADMKGWGAQRRRNLSKFFADYLVLYPEQDTVQTWAHLRAALAKKGLTVGFADLWVAATALRHGLTLLAHDSVFRQIAGLKLVCHA
ncbi:MAG: PIN domain-containing protein [Planctomycetes bacterium]|nr:PIN domain-containing protein [Planctomycetota bacterium]